MEEVTGSIPVNSTNMKFTPDTINGIIEFVSIIMMCLNIRRIYEDKEVKGLSIYSATYGWCYGAWFAYFCGELNQPISYALGCFYVLVNFIWLSLFIKYKFFKK